MQYLTKIQSFLRIHRNSLSVYVLLIIITVPSYMSLVHSGYYEMHDSQHIARLFVLNEAIHQGILYPRWVDLWGFGFGYPLFNFYPPLMYYISEAFHLIGFSLINSIKLLIVTGMIGGAIGMYKLMKSWASTEGSLVAATLFTFFGYRAVTVYVRGALAEFIAMSLLPWVMYSLYTLYKKQSLKHAAFSGVLIALLLLAHPLIAFPAVLFIGFTWIASLVSVKDKKSYIVYSLLAGAIGLSLSAFYWLPSMFERSFTLTDDILLTELASYDIHFVYLQQLWYWPWNYGGSGEGLTDGLTFQLGKIFIGLSVLSIPLFCITVIKKVLNREQIRVYLFVLFLLLFSLFMSLTYSKPIWDIVTFLGYLQFPWRFLTFTAVFMAIVGGWSFIFSENILSFLPKQLEKMTPYVTKIAAAIIILTVIIVQSKYFEPRSFRSESESELTSFKEIAWTNSRSTFEFSPKGIKTTLSELGTTIPDLNETSISQSPFTVMSGEAYIKSEKSMYTTKVFDVQAEEESLVRFNTFMFPGWKAYINGNETPIDNNNDFKLITILVPEGHHTVELRFTNTPVRSVANTITIISGVLLALYSLAKLEEMRKRMLV